MDDSFAEVKQAIIDLYSVDEDLITPDSRFAEDLDLLPDNIVNISQNLDDFKGVLTLDAARGIDQVCDLVNYIEDWGKLSESYEEIKYYLIHTLSVNEHLITLEARFAEDLHLDKNETLELYRYFVFKYGKNVSVGSELTYVYPTVGEFAKYIDSYLRITFDRIRSTIVEEFSIDADLIHPVTRLREDINTDSEGIIRIIRTFHSDAEITSREVTKIITIRDLMIFIDHLSEQGTLGSLVSIFRESPIVGGAIILFVLVGFVAGLIFGINNFNDWFGIIGSGLIGGFIGFGVLVFLLLFLGGLFEAFQKS